MTFGSSQKPRGQTDSGLEKPLIMTISGDLGSGKSLLASALVERWKADRYSTGMVQRRLAEKMGITTLELNKRAESDKSIDDQIDAVFKNLKKTAKNLVVDSRMAFHFLPESFRIKLEVHPKVAAQRIQGDTARIGEGKYDSLDDIETAIVARKASERERFKRYYDADIEDHAGYDLVINTTSAKPEVVAEIANSCIDLWKKKQLGGKLWVSPAHLYCETDPETLDPAVVEKCKVSWPIPGSWPDAAVKAHKVGHSYVVVSGAEWVAAGLKAGKSLMPVRIIGQSDQMPSAELMQKWENSFNYKHI
ncbi:MAG: hypothetical protein EBQ96_05530 [Proteobacteria bacterium]|nr:hypothetical protein [Pseudomonadota bacterium]